MNDAPRANRRKFSRGRVLRWLGLLLCGAYVTFCIAFYVNPEFWLIEANVDPTDYAEEKDLEPSENKFIWPALTDSSSPIVKIHYQKFDALVKPPKGVVFYLHGNKGNLYKCRWEIKPFLDAGYDVWMMDYRGYGKSKGPLSEAALLSDAQLVYSEILANEGLEASQTIVWGRSFGSGIAASIAANKAPSNSAREFPRDAPKALVLETPYWSLVDLVRGKAPFLPPFLFRYELPTHQYLETVTCPVHLIHGTKDEKIDIDASERLEALRQRLQLKVVPHPILGALHNVRSDSEFSSVLKRILP